MSKVLMTVKVERPVKGEEIIQVVKQCAGGDYREDKNWVDDKTFFVVGRGGPWPYKHLVVVVDVDYNETKIDPDAAYYHVGVKDWGWDSIVYAIGYTDEDIRNSLKSFRDRLQAALVLAKN